MSNYVWNKVVCSKETLEKYFIDPEPFGKEKPIPKPYISFNKLFGVPTLDEYSKKVGVHVYYGDGFSWQPTDDGFYEIKFTTRWEYPIRAILRAIELAQDTVWFAVEENCEYVSKFYWDNEVKEDIFVLGDTYFDWYFANIDFCDSLEDYDDDVWYYIPISGKQWENWESRDNFKRYLDVPAVHVDHPFKKGHES